ncbi:MAG: thioredoxin family protein [Anditalea sp.]
MNNNKRKIEVFTSGCPVCQPVVDMVQSLACDNCEVTIYDLVRQCDSQECTTKIKTYGIKRLPAVAVDGQLLSCCDQGGVSKEALQEAGVGVS